MFVCEQFMYRLEAYIGIHSSPFGGSTEECVRAKKAFGRYARTLVAV